MSGEEPRLDRVKRLVESNSETAAEIYLKKKNEPILQFPVEQDSKSCANLGLENVYVNRNRTFLCYLKRPRGSVPLPEQPRQQSDTLLNGHETTATRQESPVTVSAPRSDASREPRDGGTISNGGSKRPAEGPALSPPAVGGAEISKAVALVSKKKPRTEAISLSGADISVSLAQDRPSWHAPWKMFRGISGHLGWVRSVAVDYSNEWFATGSADRTVKIWDLASGRLKLTLTGHISTVRGIAISPRSPYMFTVGEDKTVKCWDLEQNKVIRNYHGHLSGVYCVALHPTLDVLLTGGRDSTVRVWDVRTRAQVFVLGGHRDTVNAVLAGAVDPQVISGSVDSTIRMWDLAAGKCAGTLTNHKKGVRALVRHPREFSFASASADNVKTWGLPKGRFMRNLVGHGGKLVNGLAVNEDGVLVSGGDDGSLRFWDYAGAHCFQQEQTKLQPGSLECEAGIYAMAFDHSGSRLITCEADKTIKMWKEDESATPESHPLDWKPDLQLKRY